MNTENTDTKKMERWRLILGAESEKRLEGYSTFKLSEEELLMDSALDAIYNPEDSSLGNSRLSAGRGRSNPSVSRWLGDIRALFDRELVVLIQNDAIERKGLKQLLFEPELLDNLEPDMNLASMIMMIKENVPERSKESVRAFIEKIVRQINEKLENEIRHSVTAALNRKNHSPVPSSSAIDFKYTINKNLRNYNEDLKTIIPERVWFFDRASKTNSRTVIVDIDKSGSMGESVIYSSVMSCILASMNSVKTHIVTFDTEVADLTDMSDDPVDLLYGINLGGGTDINKSVEYCQQFIESPSKTIFFLVSDLCEGGNRAALFRRIESMKESGVTVICLLAIADGGAPYYDSNAVSRIAAMDIPCFACSPEKLPDLLEAAFSGRQPDINELK